MGLRNFGAKYTRTKLLCVVSGISRLLMCFHLTFSTTDGLFRSFFGGGYGSFWVFSLVSHTVKPFHSGQYRDPEKMSAMRRFDLSLIRNNI